MNIAQTIRQYFQSKEDEIEIDPVTLSRGLVLDRLGPSYDKWGRDINLVFVKVLKKNAHHRENDKVIWEIPTEAELERVKPNGVYTRTDLLRFWISSVGNGTPPSI